MSARGESTPANTEKEPAKTEYTAVVSEVAPDWERGTEVAEGGNMAKEQRIILEKGGGRMGLAKSWHW